MIKNILKYSLGLPFLILFALMCLVTAPIVFVLIIPFEVIVGGLILGEWNFVVTKELFGAFIDAVVKAWKPID